MKKSDLLKLIQEIKEISEEEKPVIVGSQAVYSITETIPEIARKSIECDFLFIEGKSKIREEINKKLGVFSNFQIEHGFYADALGVATVVLPNNWGERLQPFLDENGEIVAYFVEIHDVAVSKLIAGREKDFQFLHDILLAEIVSITEFIKRAKLVESMSQESVLTDRLEKLKKFLESRKTTNQIIFPIQEYLRTLKNKS